ncbi:MAG TPA: hypothetical protein VHS56_14005 [Candidatus Cybelea sp.]|jgi:hypothetical protein|nr:hypothetical protein [Candidatus Cybelea sp.]
MNVRSAAAAFFVSLFVATVPANAASTALTGKMNLYNYLLKGKWSCKAGTSAYSAEYLLAPGDTLHGHLYSAQGSEDTYFGYNVAAHRYWTVSADSNGATESQTSVDGITYTGKLNDGKTLSNTTNIITMVSSKRWTIHARGAEGGQPYDLIVTCERT